MRAPISWIAEYVEHLPSPEEIAERLTMAGLEVEAIHRPSASLVEHLRVARIETMERHPDADRLSLCRVDDGEGLRHIVCGASNMKAGDAVVLATPGTVLPGGLKIKKSRIRGQDSEGMLCSAAELGLTDEQSGIIILDPSAKPGAAAAGLLGLADTILEIAVTPNRGDCLSMRGLARELAALLRAPLSPRFAVEHARHEGDSRFRIRIDAPEDCPLYRGLEIRDVHIGPSPAWLRARLNAAGLRPINVVVDVTNYVLMDRGQPLHAFDADLLAGSDILVRRAGEAIDLQTLDGQTRALRSEELVIADARGAVALAGVMGGARTAVHDGTTSLFLEAAQFRPASVRATSRRLGLVSESSIRFERGIDSTGVEEALLDAAQMIVELAGGRVVGGIARAGEVSQRCAEVRLRPSRIQRLLGMTVERGEIERIVRSLGAAVTAAGEDFMLRVPPHRHDLAREVDWIEEIARLVGYETIAETLPVSALTDATVSPAREFEVRVRERLAAVGLAEVVGLAFCSPEQNAALPGLHANDRVMCLRNPLRSDASNMRRSALITLIEAHANNVRSGARTTDLFTIGRTFSGEDDPELEVAAGLLWGPRRARGPGDAGPVLFWDIKAAVEAVAAVAGAQAVLRWRVADVRPEYHPRDCAEVSLDGEVIGYAGRLHPDLSAVLGAGENAYVFEVDTRWLASYGLTRRAVRAIGRFPVSRRDVSLIVPDSLLAGAVIETVRGSREPLVDDISVFDEYVGEGVPTGHRALGFTIVYRAADRTLTDDEVAGVHDRVVANLCKRLDVKTRI